jgi:ketosteroid isomerase-like protein
LLGKRDDAANIDHGGGVLESDLAQAIERYHESTGAFITGDPEPQKRFWSRRDDVTLANPLGPPVRGWSEVERTMERAASAIREGERPSYERVSEYATSDLAYILEIEHARAKFGGSDQFATISLRATTVWRREEEGWKIALRHADPITTPRSMDSLLVQ